MEGILCIKYGFPYGQPRRWTVAELALRVYKDGEEIYFQSEPEELKNTYAARFDPRTGYVISRNAPAVRELCRKRRWTDVRGQILGLYARHRKVTDLEYRAFVGEHMKEFDMLPGEYGYYFGCRILDPARL